MKYASINITLSSTLAWSGSTCQGLIYGLNRNILSFSALETI